MLAFWMALCIGADPAEFGEYRVGSTTWTIQDERRNRTLVTEIWYPTIAESADAVGEYDSGATSIALRDAPIAPGRFPWVIFSHGLASVREQATFLTEHLASHGYIVAAPDHPNNTGRDLNPFKVLQSAENRPVDVRVVVNELTVAARTPGNPLYGRLDERRLAVIGHSLGGSTALAAGGAWVNAHALKNGGPLDYLDFGDSRVAAVIAYMPVYEPYFDEFGLRQLKLPTMIVSGSADTVTTYEKSQGPLFEVLLAPKVLAVIEGASHFNLINEEIVVRAPFLIRAMHRPSISREVSDAEVRRLTLAFLDRVLMNSSTHSKWIRDSRPQVTVTERLTPILHSRPLCPPAVVIP